MSVVAVDGVNGEFQCRKEVNSEPQRRKFLTNLSNDGKELFHPEIMVYQEAACCAFVQQNTHISFGLFSVEDVNDRQNNGSSAFEHFSEIISIHDFNLA